MLNMRELRYENLGTNTYLVYEIGEQDAVDSMSLGMLTNNKIQGLAQTLFSQMDNRKFIKFNVSAKVTVSKFFAGAVNKKRLLGVFNGVVNAMLAAEDYMIEPSSILLDPDYIFADVSTCETDLICLPISDTETQNVDLGRFFRDIMFSTQFDQTENCEHVAKIINYLNGTPVFSLMDFKKLLGEIEGQSVQPVVPKPAVTPQPAAAPAVQSATTTAAQPQPHSRPLTSTPPAQPLQRPIQPSQPNKRNIPPAASQGQKTSNPRVQTQSDEPEISFLYLMQHYNKENAAKYKAQKAAKKAAKGAKKAKPQNTSYTVPGAPRSQKANQPGINPGYAVPGAPQQPTASAAEQPKINAGYAVPGAATPSQNTSAPQKPQSQVGSVAVPGQTPTYRPAPESVAAQQGKPVSFGETTVLSGGPIGETTVLNGAQANQTRPIKGFLIRVKTSERIPLNKPVFRIGKERSYVDYFIGDNTAISRSHADIITRDGQFFVVDANSTNHTYVNGKMLQSNDETLLSKGDRICLGNEEFEFRLE